MAAAAAAHLRQAASKIAGEQRTQVAVGRRLLPRLFHTDEVNLGAKCPLQRHEDKTLDAIRDKKDELYSMITEARSHRNRMGWRNRGLLWYLSATHRPDIERRHPPRFKAESTFSKLMGFTATSTVLFLIGRSVPKEGEPAQGEDAVDTTTT